MHTYLFIRFNDSDTSGNSWQSLPLRELVLRLDAFAGMLALLLGAASVQELQQHAGWIAAGLGPVLAQSLPGMLALGQVREVSLCLLRLSPAGVLAFVEQHQVAFAGVLALGELGLLQHHLLQRQPLPGVLPPHPAAVLLLLFLAFTRMLSLLEDRCLVLVAGVVASTGVLSLARVLSLLQPVRARSWREIEGLNTHQSFSNSGNISESS